MGQKNQNEGRGKINWLKILATPVAIVIALVYMFMQSAKNPVIAVDGVEFKLRDRAKVLTDAGFEITGGSSLDGETWDDSFYLEKDGVRYGALVLYNVSTSSQELSECQIGEFSTEADPEFYEGADKVTVNGMPAVGMSESEAKDNFGIERDAEDTAAYNKVGECSVMLSFYDDASDVYEHFSISYDFGKAY